MQTRMVVGRESAIIIQSVIVAMVLNILLSLLISSIATKDQIKPPNRAANLGFIDQFMHMLVHHNQVLFMSSLIVAIVVGVSVTVGVHVDLSDSGIVSKE